MDQPPIFFVSGLPRSGSTLLMNLLGQNPRHHVTATNGLLDLIVQLRDTWTNLTEFRALGIKTARPRIVSLMRGMIEGYYREELSQGKIIFDKCRGWLAYIELMQEVLGRPIFVLVTVRDVRAIAASFEKIYQRNPATTPRPDNYVASQTIEGRAGLSLSESGAVGLAVNRLRDALRRPHKSKLIIIPYTHLCRNTQAVTEHIHRELGLPAFKYDPNHVEQITQEDDSIHGAPLHTIRSKVQLTDETPWKGILPDALCERLVREFADIQLLAQA